MTNSKSRFELPSLMTGQGILSEARVYPALDAGRDKSSMFHVASRVSTAREVTVTLREVTVTLREVAGSMREAVLWILRLRFATRRMTTAGYSALDAGPDM
jgi:hypothetical protein